MKVFASPVPNADTAEVLKQTFSGRGRHERRNMKNAAVVLITAMLFLVSLAGPLVARDRTVADAFTLAEDPADDWRTLDTPLGRTITLYGQISQAFLGYNDGLSTRAYFPVDNDNASTRLGFLWALRSIGKFSARVRFEGGLTPRSSKDVSQLDSNGAGFELDGSNLRKLELILDHPVLGTITIGQGSMATDGISEIDFSRTTVTAFSDPSPSAGGQFIRRTDNRLSALRIKDVFDNFDGDRVRGRDIDGNRVLRTRYDRQITENLKLSLAVGKDVINGTLDTYADGALRYRIDTDTYRFGGGLGLTFKGSERVVAASGSVVLHSNNLTLTLAGAHSNESGKYRYIKVGKIWNLFPVGDTAISLDFYHGFDLVGSGSESRSIGLAAVQHFDANNTEIFALLRGYSYDDDFADYKDSLAFFTGARWKF
ncbi:hypothetical protein [Primorskyibacter sp. S87]|uniref:hypothetical protein n=1 Tax=Primorskyibacter sp. S87 TaxID=3415126 RepID=UPI003C7B757D